MTMDQISELIKDVPDFPKAGILFKDITPVLSHPLAFRNLIEHMAKAIPPKATKILAIESRGFILGSALAHHLGLGLVLVRKPGKLPRSTISHSYQLEYGEDRLEVHIDDLSREDAVVIVDDVLATGGTAEAVERLCEKLGIQVLKSLFLMEIAFLKGKDRLTSPNQSLMKV